MLTQPLATRLNLQIGDSIHSGTGALTITGIAGSPYCLSCEQVVTLPQGHQDSNAQLVALPQGANPKAVAETLIQHGFHAFRRGENGDPGGSGDSLRAAVIIAVIAGFGLLEVVLLAGTAFAVGARRQVRTLGLVAASGGDAKQVRTIVLAQGVVLGALGGIARRGARERGRPRVAPAVGATWTTRSSPATSSSHSSCSSSAASAWPPGSPRPPSPRSAPPACGPSTRSPGASASATSPAPRLRSRGSSSSAQGSPAGSSPTR